MPCLELFDRQPNDYKDLIIPRRGSLKVSMEAGITLGWEKYIGSNGISIGIDHYGASAPGKDLANHFGFTPHHVEKIIRSHLKELL